MAGEDVLELSQWTYKGRPLEPAQEPVENTDKFGLTCLVVDQLRKSRYNDVREIIEANGQIILRLIDLKVLRESGKRIWPKLELDRQQKMSALAAYLTVASSNDDSCKQCLNRKSRGPCVECVAAGPDTFSGACTNCQFSSTASACSFYSGRAVKNRKRARKNDDDDNSDSDRFSLTADLLEQATTRELERWRKLIEDEILSREAAHASHKRRTR
ncbi:uncharacterized protein F4807DRAFT_257690 [Annulohypoxylon truncatum]|uniref:uncharacterized protein n=1 Tax=Annulohypoxylon truncatum TaxID=327061 RepID=UPI0020088617|nr:uncharacterized protein F4807DRAFT_257690 [Annulohypoxylon truncatum]KAI1213294.1 hypothetical protein F4807DRAFT_257690 [Annulohypoxylon truncatum]